MWQIVINQLNTANGHNMCFVELKSVFDKGHFKIIESKTKRTYANWTD